MSWVSRVLVERHMVGQSGFDRSQNHWIVFSATSSMCAGDPSALVAYARYIQEVNECELGHGGFTSV